MKTVAFFNNKSGVGTTSLVYHLAWMFAERGLTVLAVDLDPQATLTAMFLDDDRLEELWPDDEHPLTVFGAISPILRGTGDIGQPHVEMPAPNLGLIPGDLGLSRLEDTLSEAWSRCHNQDAAAFRAMTAFHRLARQGALALQKPAVVLLDMGPNLGAINRAALIAADQVVVPLGADLFSLQGLQNLGPTMREWRAIWKDLLPKGPKDLAMPQGLMAPMGYVVGRHGIRETRPVKSDQRWVDRVPLTYRTSVLGEHVERAPKPADDPYALAMLKHYRSLMPMAMYAHKPMFALKAADGAIGSHTDAVRVCYNDFLRLARRIAAQAGLALN